VPRVEFACRRVRCDGDLMAALPCRASLRLLSESDALRAASWCACMAWGIGVPRVITEEFTCQGSHHVVQFVPWSEEETTHANEQLVMQGGDLSCEAETCRARWRLVGGDSFSRELVGEITN
jgi:hypothetical protein